MSKALYANLDAVAYGRAAQHPNHLLTQVGPGSPSGEHMRRFRQPAMAFGNVNTHPREIVPSGNFDCEAERATGPA